MSVFPALQGVGRVGNATRDAAVGLQLLPDGRGEVRVYVTGEQPGAVIRVQRGGDCLYEARADLSPQGWFGADFAADGTLHDCEVTVEAGDRTLVRYRMYEPELRPIPPPPSRSARRRSCAPPRNCIWRRPISNSTAMPPATRPTITGKGCAATPPTCG